MKFLAMFKILSWTLSDMADVLNIVGYIEGPKSIKAA